MFFLTYTQPTRIADVRIVRHLLLGRLGKLQRLVEISIDDDVDARPGCSRPRPHGVHRQRHV